MTVCLGALADRGNAIVCIADKALTYQNYGTGNFQWDADVTKIVTVGSHLVGLMSGAEESSTRLVRKLHNIDEFGNSVVGTMATAETEYAKVLEELTTALFLTPNMLTKRDYVEAISKSEINPHIKAIADSIQSYDMQCDMLLCGFSGSGKQRILHHIRAPGVCTDMTHTGFHAVGAGWERAVSQMLWNDYERTNSIARVFYDAFDAKCNAEMTVGVGYDWDAMVIVRGARPFRIPKQPKELVERAWSKYNRSPFKKRNPKEDLDPPPKNWKEQLEEYFKSLTAPTGASRQDPESTTSDQSRPQPSPESPGGNGES